MKTFKDLQFQTNTLGIQSRIEFTNGYGASIIKTPFSYGGKQGLYELAILRDGDLCYTTPITNDVLGWLNEDDVNKALADIQNL